MYAPELSAYAVALGYRKLPDDKEGQFTFRTKDQVYRFLNSPIDGDRMPLQRISEMLSLANTDSRLFPATIFYNEGWLLRLVLDWFSRHRDGAHPLRLAPMLDGFLKRFWLPNFRSTVTTR